MLQDVILNMTDEFPLLQYVFQGDDVPNHLYDEAMEAAKGCDAFLVLGSSLANASAYTLVRYQYLQISLTNIQNLFKYTLVFSCDTQIT